MRALLLVAILVLSGCATTGRTASCPAESRAESGGDKLVHVDLLNDRRDASVACFRVEDGPVHEARRPGGTFTPNVGHVADLHVPQGAARIIAWIPGGPEQAKDLEPGNETWVTLAVNEQGLTILTARQQPAYD